MGAGPSSGIAHFSAALRLVEPTGRGEAASLSGLGVSTVAGAGRGLLIDVDGLSQRDKDTEPACGSARIVSRGRLAPLLKT
jgi:hypothetical protein